MNYLVLTHYKKDPGKPDLLKLEGFAKGKSLGYLLVRSGLANVQNFRTKDNQVKGKGEPIPEGVYSLAPMLWKGGFGNYAALYPGIKSPIWQHIDPTVVPNRYLGIHLDHPTSVLGTLGCVGLATISDCETLAKWVEKNGQFTRLFVDWGIGTVKVPELDSPQDEEPCQHRTGIGLVYGKEMRYKNIDGETWVRSTDLGKASWVSDRTFPLVVERTT